MRRPIVSLLAAFTLAGCFCTSAAQAQTLGVGVSKRAMERRLVDGIGLLTPDEFMMCKAVVSPVDGSFAPVPVAQGEGFDFIVSNDAEVPVSVVLESRDPDGELQGALLVKIGPEDVRRLTLHFWSEAQSSALEMSTYLRVMPYRGSDDISVTVSQQKADVDGATEAKEGQVMDCSGQGCSLRKPFPGAQSSSEENSTPSNPDSDLSDPDQGEVAGIGPHGPHLSNSSEDRVKEMEEADSASGEVSEEGDQG